MNIRARPRVVGVWLGCSQVASFRRKPEKNTLFSHLFIETTDGDHQSARPNEPHSKPGR